MKLIISLGAVDPKAYAALATAVVTLVTLALARELSKTKTEIKERGRAEECVKVSRVIAIISTVVILVTLILWLI